MRALVREPLAHLLLGRRGLSWVGPVFSTRLKERSAETVVRRSAGSTLAVLAAAGVID